MANNLAVIGTTSSHNGKMISASGSGISTPQGAACLEGDSHDCPTHGVTALTGGMTSKAVHKGKKLAMNGSTAACGAVLNGNFATHTEVK
jgi:uncharacterized Zn-binding protein involved in type VI secretion